MKREATRFSMMAVIVILVTQLYTIVPVSQAFQSENVNQRTYSMRVDPASQPGRRRGRGLINQGYRCQRRCRREYNICLTYAGTSRGRRRACAVRYRNCVRRCAI
jgi:hypothetical protein